MAWAFLSLHILSGEFRAAAAAAWEVPLTDSKSDHDFMNTCNQVWFLKNHKVIAKSNPAFFSKQDIDSNWQVPERALRS